ncbi:MAG TPA: TIR domain-containing protein, partial [Bryobacteraceae bacterium]
GANETRTLFEQFIQTHISKHAAAGSVERMTVIICPTCSYEFTNDLLQKRLARGFDHAICPVCGTRIPLPSAQFDAPPALSPELERRTELERERTAARDRLQTKIAAGEFDAYFSYRDEERQSVVEIANRLRDAGILPWIDFEQLRPGQEWATVMNQQLARAKTLVSFVGASGVGPHQSEELDTILKRSSVPIIPVILPGAPDNLAVPGALLERQWVDFRRSDPDPMEVLIWGITGVRGGGTSSATQPDAPPAAPDLESALEAAERRQDWAAARQFLLEIAHLNKRTDPVRSIDCAIRALRIADDPFRLDGTGMDEPLGMLSAQAHRRLIAWLPKSSHRLTALQILREIAKSGTPYAGDVLSNAGIHEWQSWFDQPEAASIPTLPHGSGGWPSFRVRCLRLLNIKSFETFSCDVLDEHSHPRPMSAFVGDNATGKSTLLQCVALACLGTSFANKIEGISAQTLLRKGASGGAIQLDVELAIDPEASRQEVMTVRLGIGLDPSRKDFYELRPSHMLDGDVNHMDAWNMLRGATGLRWGFCAGYGAFRALRERRETLSPSSTTSLELDRVSSLFQPQATLLEPAVLEALFQADISMLSRAPVTIPLGVRDRIVELFRDNIPGIDVREQDGKLRLVEIHSGVSSASALSDGCNSMIGLLAHVIRHALEITDWVRDPRTAEGVVLIDEVDLHLHPKWQRVALTQLEQAFPKLQFIITTHSPLVLGGVPDGNVNILQRDEEGRTELVSGPSVKGWRVDQLLTGVHFDVGSPYDLATDQLSEEYGRLLELYGPDHPLVKEKETQLDSRMGHQHGSTPLDREIWTLLDEFVDHRWSQRTEDERTRAKAKMWEALNS